MSNTEWKNGYDQGFAAGWKAAKADKDLNYQNYPPVYYAGGPTDAVGSFSTTMADTLGIVSGAMTDTISLTGVTPYSHGSYSPGAQAVQLNEKKKINNLTDHTLIV